MAENRLLDAGRPAASHIRIAARASLDIRHVVIDDVTPHPSAANGIHHVVRRIAREQIAAGDDPRIIILRRPDVAGEPEPKIGRASCRERVL